MPDPVSRFTGRSRRRRCPTISAHVIATTRPRRDDDARVLERRARCDRYGAPRSARVDQNNNVRSTMALIASPLAAAQAAASGLMRKRVNASASVPQLAARS